MDKSKFLLSQLSGKSLFWDSFYNINYYYKFWFNFIFFIKKIINFLFLFLFYSKLLFFYFFIKNNFFKLNYYKYNYSNKFFFKIIGKTYFYKFINLIILVQMYIYIKEKNYFKSNNNLFILKKQIKNNYII